MRPRLLRSVPVLLAGCVLAVLAGPQAASTVAAAEEHSGARNTKPGDDAMRSRLLRILLVLAAVPALVALAPAGARAVEDPTTRLTNLTFTPSGPSLRGTSVQFVQVSLTLVDPDGIPVEQGSVSDGGLTCPCVVVVNERVVEPRSRTFFPVTLHLASGTERNGVWQGVFAVGAQNAGLWRAVGLHAGDLKTENDLWNTTVTTPQPWRAVTLNVRGYDWPSIWLGTRVRARPSVDIVRGGASLVRSHRPVANARLEIRHECSAYMYPLFLKAVRTDARGRYSLTVNARNSYVNACAALVAYPTDTPGAMVAVSNTRQWPAGR